MCIRDRAYCAPIERRARVLRFPTSGAESVAGGFQEDVDDLNEKACPVCEMKSSERNPVTPANDLNFKQG
eukprot:12276301-Alexandrium_andersonii.AAC.1